MTIAVERDKEVVQQSLWKWVLTDQDGVGQAISNPASPDRSVQAMGTFNSGDVTLYGSNLREANPAVDDHWSILHDHLGENIVLSANGISTIAENVYWIRPVMAGTAGAASVTVLLLSKGGH